MRIAIDAGHRSTTPGKRTPPFPYDVDVYSEGSYIIKAGEQFNEHIASVGVCAWLDIALKRCGFETYKVAWDDANGTDDEMLDNLSERQLYVLAGACDLCVSIHWNAFGAEFNNAEGLETWLHSVPARVGDSKAFAEAIHTRLIQATGQVNRGLKRDSWAMCDCIMLGTKAAILVELGFMTNLKEATTMMANASYWKVAAEAICMGVCDYTGATYIPEQQEEAMSLTFYEAKKIVQESAKLSDQAMFHLGNYFVDGEAHGSDLIIKLAEAIKGGA